MSLYQIDFPPMVDVLTRIVIEKSISTVAIYATNPDNAPTWYVNIKSVEWKTEPPMQVGSQVAFKAQFLGKKLAYVYKVVELLPNQKLVMRTADGPFPMETTYIWESLNENSTQMTLRNRGTPSGFSRLMAPFMSLAMRRANMNDLKKLKLILEEG